MGLFNNPLLTLSSTLRVSLKKSKFDSYACIPQLPGQDTQFLQVVFKKSEKREKSEPLPSPWDTPDVDGSAEAPSAAKT